MHHRFYQGLSKWPARGLIPIWLWLFMEALRGHTNVQQTPITTIPCCRLLPGDVWPVTLPTTSRSRILAAACSPRDTQGTTQGHPTHSAAAKCEEGEWGRVSARVLHSKPTHSHYQQIWTLDVTMSFTHMNLLVCLFAFFFSLFLSLFFLLFIYLLIFLFFFASWGLFSHCIASVLATGCNMQTMHKRHLYLTIMASLPCAQVKDYII